MKTEKEDFTGSMVAEVGQMEHWPPPPAADPAGEKTNGSDPFNEAHAPMTEAPEGDITTGTKPFGRRKNNQPHEEAFKYLSPDHPEIDDIYNFYQLSPRFPRDRFMVRNAMGEPVKAMYYTTALAKDILSKNEGRGMKFVHSGVKMFVKQDAQGQNVCRWRIQSEGLPILEGWVGDARVVKLRKRETLRYLLREMFPKIGGDSFALLGEIGEQVREMGMGCCVLRVEASDDEDGFT